MEIGNNFNILLKQILSFFSAFNNRVLILATTAQIFSMIVKVIINIIKNKKLSLKVMTSYGGMPSSHTVFVASFLFGIALDPEYGWISPFFAIGIVVAAIVLIDAIKFRGTVDRINDCLKEIVSKNPEYSYIKLPKYIAHTVPEIIVGVIFAFLYTFIFYLFFYNFFTN